MNTLAKWVIGGTGVLILAWAGLSAYTGVQLQHRIEADLNPGLAVPGLGELTLLRYERGLLSASARYRLTPAAGALPSVAGAPPVFDFNATLSHGPWPLARLLQGQLTPVLARATAEPVPESGWQAWFQAAQGQTPLIATATLHHNGEVSFQAQVAALNLQQTDSRLVTTTAHVQGHATPGLQQLHLEGQLPEIRLTSLLPTTTGSRAPTEVRLHTLRWQSQQQRGAYQLYPGQAELHIDTIHINTQDDRGQPLAVMVEPYQMRVEVAEQGPEISALLDYTLGEITIADVGFGALEASFRLQNLHGPTLQQIIKRYQTLLAGTPLQPPTEAAFEHWFQQSWQALLPYRPTLDLDPLRWELPQGRSWLQWHAQLQPPTSQAPLAALANLEARLVVSRPMLIEALARLSQLPGGSGLSLDQARAAASLNVALLQRLALASGYVVADQDALMAQLRYAAGQLTLNDQPLPLPQPGAPWLQLP